MKMSDKKVAALWGEAVRLACTALADELPGSFADRSDVVAVAAALLAGGYVSNDATPKKTRSAGVDAEQNEALNSRAKAYGE